MIVEAAERSGSLTTADFAADLGRTVAAVPGRVTSRTAAGTNGLIQTGAALVRDAGDVLDLLAEPTGAAPPGARPRPSRAARRPSCAACSTAIEDGRGDARRARRRRRPRRAAVLAGLGELEFRGLVRRTFGGRYEPAAG